MTKAQEARERDAIQRYGVAVYLEVLMPLLSGRDITHATDAQRIAAVDRMEEGAQSETALAIRD